MSRVNLGSARAETASPPTRAQRRSSSCSAPATNRIVDSSAVALVIFVVAQAGERLIDLQQPPVKLALDLLDRGIRQLAPQLLPHHGDADLEHLEGQAKVRSCVDGLPTHEASVANSAKADLRMRTPLSTCTAGSEPSFTIR